MPVRVVVMGPSGSGKSTVGAALAEALGARFIDGDDLHPLTNVDKMAAGIPLDDVDRMPWLREVGDALAADDRVVIACSALRRVYRDAIRESAPDAFFAELRVGRAELAHRLGGRTDHFMPIALLDSQLQTLEPLEPGERGIRVDPAAVDRCVEVIREAVTGDAAADQSLR
ncbi:gluconokinase [Microbacterium sp. 179-I 3D4 NHS]|uniref:gluconokinase n=1 Tax=Microbacterium sp. 179-I 3D4 NHS TaxID=3142381 RepID=UPI0039A1401E